MITQGPKMFAGRQKVLLYVANELKISDTELISFGQLPLINNDKQLIAAIIL